ncbi:MAG: PAS domain-containing protein [Alphaproteobacteria bacterium]|nr:PAS domain-containing protein [Alphaproteobacteria bacterium]
MEFEKWSKNRVIKSKFWNAWKNKDASSAENAGSDARSTEKPQKHTPLSPKEKYDYLTQYGTQILCLLSPDDGCTYLSRNFDQLTGQSGDACIGDGFYDLVHEDYQSRLLKLLAEADGKPQTLRCKLRHVDGYFQWYKILVHPRGENGQHVCIIDNIHDSMQAQSTLHKARLEAELALRARSEFLANMSHELRTPLNAVIGFSQIIESEMFGKIANPQYIEYVRHIQESGYDLLARIEDLLEIANIDAGRVVIDREEVYISEMLKQVSDAQTHHAFAARVVLKQPPVQQDLLLYVDRIKVQHILGHLVANAIKFAQEGGHVILDAALTYEGDVRIRVSDNGVGMTDAKLNNIVAALAEDNCWVAKNNRHIGLGLALTKEFVTLHGGRLSVSSKTGSGTTVDIILPKECICSPMALRQNSNALQAVG